MTALFETLENAAAGLVMSLIGTYLISLHQAAKLLDEDRATELQQHVEQIEELKKATAKPGRTLVEEYHFNIAKAAIDKHGPPAEVVLRHLRIQGQMVFGAYSPPLPPGVNANEALDMLTMLTKSQIVTHTLIPRTSGYENVFQIAPGVAAALDELLYNKE